MVASFAPDGAHRWSRRLPVTGAIAHARIDPCGATVVVSTDHAFDPGRGPLLADQTWSAPKMALARFAPREPALSRSQKTLPKAAIAMSPIAPGYAGFFDDGTSNTWQGTRGPIVS